MALIGAINITMSATADKFNSGIASAQKSLTGFAKTADRMTGGIGSYAANWGKVAKDIGGPALKGFGGYLKDWGSAGKEILGDPFKRIGTSMGKAASGAAKLGVGFGKIALSTTAGGFGMVSNAIGGMVKATRNAINEVGKFAGIAGLLGSIGLAKVAQGAIALGEQTDRARIVFGDFAQGVIDQSKMMGAAFGVSQKDFITAASAFGTIFQGVGYDKKATADLSTHFVKLATDLSSFAHIPVAEAMEKIQSGLAGQIRPLREVGVFMSQEAVDAKAAAMGLGVLGGTLTENQKVQARVAFLTEKLAIAQGNLAQTAGSAGNQVRSLSGRFQNLSDTVGSALLGVAGPAMDDLSMGINALQIAWNNSAIGAANATVGVLGATHEQAKGIGWVQKSIGFVVDAWQILDMGFYKVQSTITGGIITILESFHGLAEGIGKTVSYFTGMTFEASSFAAAWIDDLKRIRDEQDKTFQMKLAAPAASESINAAFEASRAKVQAARDALLKTSIDVTKIKPAAETIKASGKHEFAKAITLGSKESANAILTSRYGAGVAQPDTGIKATAKNTATANGHLARISASMDKLMRSSQMAPYEVIGDLG